MKMKDATALWAAGFVLVLAMAPAATAQQNVPQQGSGALAIQFGPAQPEHQQLADWVTKSVAIRDHLAWLSSNIALPHDIPVVFRSCGLVNAFYSHASRSITFCYEWINQRIELARSSSLRSSLPRPTDAALTDAVLRSTEFVINHELGHALIDLLALPVLGREEDAADGFGAFILLERGGPQDAYSVLQGALSFGQHYLFENGSQADEHSLNDQRYYNLLCWVLGSDPTRFGGYAQRGGLPVSRQERCPAEWSQLRTSWVKVLNGSLRPSTTTVDSAMSSVTSSSPLMIARGERLQIGAGKYWSKSFHIAAVQCRTQLKIVAVAGGSLDVETMVFEQPSFLTWQSASTSAEPVFKSGKVRQTVLDVPIHGPGDFVVVVSNMFSMVTSKTVDATAAVLCP